MLSRQKLVVSFAGLSMLAAAMTVSSEDRVVRRGTAPAVVEKELQSEHQPLQLMIPSAAIRNLPVVMLLRPTIPHLLSDTFTLTPQYEFENTLQAVAPHTPGCEGGAAILSSGQNDHSAFVRAPLFTSLETLDTTAASTKIDFPTTAQQLLGTDNVLMKLKDGSLMAVRNGVTWEDVANKPPWWNNVTIQGSPHGARVCAFVWRSTDCGRHWTPMTAIDPLNFENGRYAVPRPVEAGCPQGCYGGWDRTEVYADPWDGSVYVSMNATGGARINYATGAQIEGPQSTELVFRSTDNGQSWTEVFNFGAWTPVVISSTPNGRVYLYSVIGNQPTLFYSLLSAKPNIQFSAGKPVFYTQGGVQIPAGADAAYSTLVYKATNSISRISTDAATSKVRLTYSWVAGNGKTGLAVVAASVPNDNADPVVTPLTLFQAARSTSSILASNFINPDPAAGGSNTSILYWVEGSTDANEPAAVRYSIFQGSESAGTAAATLADAGKPTASPAHYTYGGEFTATDGSLNFVAQWPQQDGIHARIVTIPPAPGPERFDAVWVKGPPSRPAVWGWAKADFDKRAADMAAQGFVLDELNAFVLPGAQGERYNAVWIRTNQRRQAVWGWARTDFDRRAAELQHQGYQLLHVNAFVLPQGERFNAIWAQSNESHPAVWGWARVDLDHKVAELRNQGFGLIDLNAFVLPGQGERFNAVWAQGTAANSAVWGWTQADLETHDAQMRKDGFHLLDVNAFVLPAGTRYNAIWTKTKEETAAAWGWARWDFDRRDRELRSQGFQARRLNGFVLP